MGLILPLSLITALYYHMLNNAEKWRFRFSCLEGKETATQAAFDILIVVLWGFFNAYLRCFP